MPAAPPTAALFDAGFLRRLEALALAARQLTRGRDRAERRSARRGASVEFAGYRPFVAGDDLRHVDWNAYARWRQLVLKLFVEEEDLHVHLLLDCSASMAWGAPTRKFDHARRVVAGLAYLTLANLDRAAVVPLGVDRDATLRPWPPSRGRHRFLPLLRYLEDCPMAPATPVSLADAAGRWTATGPRRGMALWVSDLWGNAPGDALAALDRLRHAGHETAVIQILDPAEGGAGDVGEYELEDVETGGRRTVVVDGRMRRDYRQRFTDYQETIRRYCRQHALPLLQADTGTSVPDLLLRALREGGFVG